MSLFRKGDLVTGKTVDLLNAQGLVERCEQDHVDRTRTRVLVHWVDGREFWVTEEALRLMSPDEPAPAEASAADKIKALGEAAKTELGETAVEEALRVIRTNREGTYGGPQVNLPTIATFWSKYLSVRCKRDITVDAVDVCYLMCLLKLARLANAPRHRDSLVDLVGYADLADILKRLEEPQGAPDEGQDKKESESAPGPAAAPTIREFAEREREKEREKGRPAWRSSDPVGAAVRQPSDNDNAHERQ